MMPTATTPPVNLNNGRGTRDAVSGIGSTTDQQTHEILLHGFFMTHVVAMFIAFIQRAGMLGTIRLSPVTHMIWSTFTAQWSECKSICVPDRVINGQDSRCEEMVESRAVGVSLSGLILAENSRARPVSPNSSYITECAVIARQFCTNAIDPATTPYMIASLIDMTLRLDMFIILQLFSASLKVPVLPHGVVVEWFTVGTIQNRQSKNQLSMWLSEMIRNGNTFVDPNNPSQMFLSLGRNSDDPYYGSIGNNNNNNNNNNNSSSEFDHAQNNSNSNLHPCSAFQVHSKSGNAKDVVLGHIAKKLYETFRRELVSRANIFNASPLLIALKEIVGQDLRFPWVYGTLDAFSNTRNMLECLTLSIVSGSTPLPTPDRRPFDENYHHVPFQLLQFASTWTLAVDVRWLLWATSISCFPGTSSFQPAHISQHAKYYITKSLVDAFFRYSIPLSVFPATVASLGIPEPATQHMCMMKISAGEPYTMLSQRSGCVTTARCPSPANRTVSTVCNTRSAVVRRIRMDLNDTILRHYVGYSKNSMTGRVEDIAAISPYYTLAALLKVDKIRDIPTGHVSPPLCRNRWFPAISYAHVRIIACKLQDRRQSHDGTRVLELLISDPTSSQSPSVQKFDAALRLGLPFFPIPDVARRGVLVYFHLDDAPDDLQDPCNLDEFSENNMIKKPLSFDSNHILKGVVTRHGCLYGVLVPHPHLGETQYLSDTLHYNLVCSNNNSCQMGVWQMCRSIVPYGTDLLIDMKTASMVKNRLRNFTCLPNTRFTHHHKASQLLAATLTWEDPDHDDNIDPATKKNRMDVIWVIVQRKTVDVMVNHDCDTPDTYQNISFVVKPSDLVELQSVRESDINPHFLWIKE
eukprot:3938596-Rhodomonas_salina.8